MTKATSLSIGDKVYVYSPVHYTITGPYIVARLTLSAIYVVLENSSEEVRFSSSGQMASYGAGAPYLITPEEAQAIRTKKQISILKLSIIDKIDRISKVETLEAVNTFILDNYRDEVKPL